MDNKEKNTFLDRYKSKITKNKTENISPPAADKKQPKESITVKTPARNNRLTAVIAGAVILALAVTALVLFLNRGIEMIDLTNWTENDAQLWARNNGIMLQIEHEFNDEYEEGRVMSQSVPPGSRVKKNEFVKLIVSAGHDLSVTLPIPDFMSMTRQEIEAWAAENFMTKVRVTTEYSDTVEAGRVIRFEINDDRVVDEVRRDSPIYIIISKGPEDAQAALVQIPDFKAMSITEAYVFADENGIVLNVKEEYDDFAPAGSILSQSVKAEEEVPKGSEIEIIVSKGKKIIVPDFSGMNKEIAASLAAELGITVSINERYSNQPAGAFISQSIKPGSIYESGQVLELNYSIDNRIPLPSFVRQTRDAIEAWAQEHNKNGASITIKAANTRSNSPPGTILSQSKANTLIGVNTTINITVSSGKVVYVPDFVAPAGSGYDAAITREKAIAICEELNIVPIFVEEKKSGRLPGEIWSQSIAAGKEISEGTTITLKYNPVNVQVTVPDFTNMTKEQIWAKNYHKSLDIRFEEGTEYKEGQEGRVYEQSLCAGTKTASGSVIKLTVRPKEMGMPDPLPNPEENED